MGRSATLRWSSPSFCSNRANLLPQTLFCLHLQSSRMTRWSRDVFQWNWLIKIKRGVEDFRLAMEKYLAFGKTVPLFVISSVSLRSCAINVQHTGTKWLYFHKLTYVLCIFAKERNTNDGKLQSKFFEIMFANSSFFCVFKSFTHLDLTIADLIPSQSSYVCLDLVFVYRFRF